MSEYKDYENELNQYIANSEKTQDRLEEWYNCYRGVLVDANVVLTALDTLRAFNIRKGN